ncbi:MAG: nicotinate phosphoribosyltransferase [Bacteroidota bacterium]|nr:nicotinate phosphoribosyltransferase [Bacteroidota bacterium]
MLPSILDNDLYKFSMQHAVITLFPRSKTKYSFINRGKTEFPHGFADRLTKEINKMSNIRLSKEEKMFMTNKCKYLPPTYFDFLKGYEYNPEEVKIKQTGGELKIEIEGYWYRTILWEVPLMALVSKLYFEMTKPEVYKQEKIIDIIENKAQIFNKLNVPFADFGTRRRFSFNNHDLVVRILKENSKNFVGTSNVFLAFKNNISPIGTHAHEWFMFHAAKFGFKISNKLALENWVKIFRGDLGIALSDTFTSEAFFNAFDTKLAKLFDGVRQDSGNPIEFGYKVIKHYKNLNIDPNTKTIVFSDALNPTKIEEISKEFKGKIKSSFGIGTNLTNDVGAKPLNMVIKITEALPEGKKWIPTIKLSDSKGKYTGDPNTIRIAKIDLGIK